MKNPGMKCHSALNTHHVIQRIERKALRTRLYVISPRPRVQGYTRKKNSYIIQEAFSKTRLRVQRPCLLFPTTTLQSQEIRPSRRPSSQLPSKAIMLLLEDKSEVGAAAAVCVCVQPLQQQQQPCLVCCKCGGLSRLGQTLKFIFRKTQDGDTFLALWIQEESLK